MKKNILRYFAGGNTAKGFYSLYDTNLIGLKRVFVLSGNSKREKSVFIQRLLDKWSELHLPMEVIHSAANHTNLEGLIIRKLGFAIVDGDQPRELGKDDVRSSQWETIDLDQASKVIHDEEKINKISELKINIDKAFTAAYASYNKALSVHDDWEDIYIRQMDFNQADQVIHQLLLTLYESAEEKKQNLEEPQIKRRFLGAATPAGAVDFVDNITAGLTRRFFLKGRAGTGKSTILKKIVAKAEELNYSAEVYHCGFDPGSLDMVIVRELGWAVFDSTKPHEYFPERLGDEVIDMYELTVAPGTDETFADDIAKIEAAYRANMDDGKKYLIEAKQYQDELERINEQFTDYTQLDRMYNELNEQIQLLANNINE